MKGELGSPGQAEAYPKNRRCFQSWGMLQLATASETRPCPAGMRHTGITVFRRHKVLWGGIAVAAVLDAQRTQSGKAATKGIFTTEAGRHRESQNQMQDPRARRWRRPRSGGLTPWGRRHRNPNVLP